MAGHGRGRHRPEGRRLTATTSTPTGRGVRASRHDPRWTLAACVLASSLSFVDGSVLNVALPAIRSSYGARAETLQWVVNSYLLPLSALLLLGGALGDHFGRRRLLVIGTGLFALASLACALAPGVEILLSGRLLQGIGAALLLPNSLALLNAAFEGERRGRAVGIWAAAGAAAAAVAPLIGGWLVDHVGWASIFYINLPLALGAIILALGFVTESRDQTGGRTDYGGAVTATLGLGGVTYALTRWSATTRFDGQSIAAAVAGVALLALFLGIEHRRRERAMMPLAMFGEKAFAGLNLMTFLLYGAFGAVMLLVPYLLIEALGYSPVQAGLALIPLPIVIAAGSPLMGGLAERIGPRLPLTVGPLVVAAGMMLGLRMGAGAGYWSDIFPAITLMALGMAIAVAPLTSTVLVSVDRRHTGTASGLNSAVARLGGLIATALLGGVLALKAERLVGGFHHALLACSATGILAGVAALLTVRGRPPRRSA